MGVGRRRCGALRRSIGKAGRLSEGSRSERYFFIGWRIVFLANVKLGRVVSL